MSRRLSLLAGAVCALVLLVSHSAAAQEAVEYYATDAIGSVRVVFASNGNVKGRMDFGPYGEQLTTAEGIGQKVFAQITFDGESALDYAEARMFQLRTGRFNVPDPVFDAMEEPQAWNRYAYVVNNPLAFTDATGLNKDPCEGLISDTSACVSAPKGNIDLLWFLFFSWNSGGGGGGGSQIGDGSGKGVVVPKSPSPGAPGEQLTGNTEVDPSQPPSCTQYVDSISNVVEAAGWNYAGIGNLLYGSAMANTMRGPKRGVGPGFRPELVAGGQQSDVYRHLNFIIGSALEANPGKIAGFLGLDIVGYLGRNYYHVSSRDQRIPELRDDIAAIRAGASLTFAVISRNFSVAKREMKQVLCEAK